MLLPSPAFPGPSTDEALNCLRVLGRVLVVVYEMEDPTWANTNLWARKPRGSVDLRDFPGSRHDEPPADLAIEDDQFTLGDDDDEDADEGARAFKASVGRPRKASTATQKSQAEENGGDTDENGTLRDPLANPGPAAEADEEQNVAKHEDLVPSLAERLFSCTVDLLFCAGFSVPESVRGEDHDGDKVNYVIWEKGVGSTVSIGSTSELDRNKVEVLRFLLILLSTTMYILPGALQSTPNPLLEHLTHDLERRLVLSLLCSLLNTSVGSPKTGTSAMPYNHLVFRASDERRSLVRMCLMTLLVALDYRSFDSIPQTPGTPGVAEAKDENAFRFFVSKLHRKDDFAFVLGGIIGILEEHLAVSNNYLPGSKKPVPYLLEAFMLLWRLVDLNKRFRAYVFESGKAIDIIGYVLICCLEFKGDPSQHGFLRLLSYLLQTLSADQAFGSAINQPLRQAVPAKWAVQGSAADFMIVSIYSIATTPGLNQLFPALTIAITNAAPHLRHIGVQASTRLLQLFKAFSAPNFLLADEGHPRLVYYLLETFNSILYYQLNENPNVVYSILQSHQDFQKLATFTLLSGLREIQRKKALREERAAAAAAAAAPARPGLVRSNSELAMLAEKAALLGREIDDDEDDHIASPPTAGGSAPSTPTVDAPPAATPSSTEEPPRPLSEKARGKMRATESTTSLPLEDDEEELMKVAAAGVGPTGYVPTQEWVSSWQKGLPLDPVLVAISELLPKIQDSQPPRTGGPSSKVFNLLKGMSLGDALPPAPPVVPRKFQWSPQSCVWLTSLLWGDIYVAGLAQGLWKDTTVRLFGVKQAPAKGRPAQVDRMLKMIGVV